MNERIKSVNVSESHKLLSLFSCCKSWCLYLLHTIPFIQHFSCVAKRRRSVHKIPCQRTVTLLKIPATCPKVNPNSVWYFLPLSLRSRVYISTNFLLHVRLHQNCSPNLSQRKFTVVIGECWIVVYIARVLFINIGLQFWLWSQRYDKLMFLINGTVSWSRPCIFILEEQFTFLMLGFNLFNMIWFEYIMLIGYWLMTIWHVEMPLTLPKSNSH